MQMSVVKNEATQPGVSSNPEQEGAMIGWFSRDMQLNRKIHQERCSSNGSNMLNRDSFHG
jgi:hypothetical protein